MFGLTKRSRPVPSGVERAVIDSRPYRPVGTVFRLDTNAGSIGRPDSYDSVESANAAIQRVLAKRTSTTSR